MVLFYRISHGLVGKMQAYYEIKGFWKNQSWNFPIITSVDSDFANRPHRNNTHDDVSQDVAYIMQKTHKILAITATFERWRFFFRLRPSLLRFFFVKNWNLFWTFHGIPGNNHVKFWFNFLVSWLPTYLFFFRVSQCLGHKQNHHLKHVLTL